MPLPPPKTNLDGMQVLTHSFEQATGEIRVKANITTSATPVEVIITHLDDSIRLGDGSNFITSTTVGPNVGLDVNIIGSDIPITVDLTPLTTPLIVNQTATLANTEYSYAFPLNTRKFLIRARGSAKLQFSFTSGQSGIEFITIFSGNSHIETDLELTTKSIYYQSNKSGEKIEILTWS